MARIAFLTCHLSGSGHLVRTLTLARTARAAGHHVVVMNGGRALGHLDADPSLVQLPPVTIRGLEFNLLRRPDGEIADADYLASRRRAITATLSASPPDALVTELYPFGRRALHDEFSNAIVETKRLSPNAAILCSVRDIPEPKPKRLDETVDRLADYDGVLVHGDANLIPLTATWALPDTSRIHHTGYLGRMMPTAPRGDSILVSTGGGVLGRDVAAMAAKAAGLSAHRWHILIGGADAAEVAAATPGPARTEPARSDFPDLLAGAAVSVSLCGYNTAVDLVQCTTPALIIPSIQAGEQEQSIRARAFAGLAGFKTVSPSEMTPELLAEIVDELAHGPSREASGVHVDQGQRAVAAIEGILKAKAA